MKGKKVKIFLIDDDKLIVEMYATKFKSSGYEVTTTTDPQEFLSIARDGLAPDVVMFDIIMPGIDGWELLRTIRKENLVPDAKVIILSNQGQQSDIEMSRQYDIDGYIIKALMTPSKVLEKVEEIYSKKKSK
jgi:CheY-like chemotaxis protein